MNSKQIQSMIDDSRVVRRDSLNDLNSAQSSGDKKLADATNRVAIAVTLVAEGILGIQLEGAVVREAMEEAHNDGGKTNMLDIQQRISQRGQG